MTYHGHQARRSQGNIGGCLMKTSLSLLIVPALAMLAPEASAGGRYTRGRTVFWQKCAPCTAIGWKWAPGHVGDWTKINLAHLARSWSTAKVCTWMRKSSKKRTGPLCHPSRMTYREKLNALYYTKRRAQGAIVKPRLRRRSAALYRGPGFVKRAGSRRALALRRLRAMKRLQKARRRLRHRGRFNWSRGRSPTRGGRRSGRRSGSRR